MGGVHPLFQPVRVGAVPLANRVVMAPMTRRRADAANVPSPLAAEYYAQRASAGLIVSEASLVTASGASYPGSPGMYDAAQVDAWRAVTGAVHARGGRIFAQLWHAGRFSDPAFLGGALPVAPSAIPIAGEVNAPGGPRPFVTPRALDAEEIARIVEDFAAAAERAREAGFDGVEVHAAQGYLIDQFLRDGSNARTDAYGGSIDDRARFLVEVTSAVIRAWSADRVGVQLSPTSPLGGMRDSDPPATFAHAALTLDALGVAYLNVFEPLGQGARVSPLMRAKFRRAFIVNGGYDGRSARAALDAGDADLVSFGRPYIANPDLVERLAEGAPLASPDPATFYGGGARGYTDYAARA